MPGFRKICLWCSGIALLVLLAGLGLRDGGLWRPAALALSVGLAIGMGAVPRLAGYQYTVWIIAAVVAGMLYPAAFSHWGSIDLRNKWLVLIVVQLVMFGMGTQMRLRDFTGLAGTGKGVLIGLACHFSVMPLTGYLLTRVFHFEPEIAAGIILIGSCSSGLASNVMVYIARANLTLSVAVTAMATLAAPFFTPLLMKLLAGTYIHVQFGDMMLEIVKIVLVPIGAALLHDYLNGASSRGRRWVLWVGVVAAVWLVVVVCGAGSQVTGFFAGAILVGIGYHYLVRRFSAVERVMPYISMAGIVYFTTVTTAAGRDNLLHVGLLLFLASVFHNAAGYFFGYWLSRLFRLDKNAARTVAFEVGLQNGGMASGLAGSMGKLGTVGLAAAVFSPWMNISGSILANYWRNRPAEDRAVVARESGEELLPEEVQNG
ncbi:MAG TPA: bile acid:sodium symporter family protein [Puia sp.]|nr:bile acid:sodium symporter family protein [Puia sp.]